MESFQGKDARLADTLPSDAAAMARGLVAGLQASHKHIPPKYLYDARGSALFERITALPEYYLTRAERRILQERGGEVGSLTGPGALVVEFGSGSGVKARVLLRQLSRPAGYVPVDVSPAALEQNVCEMAHDFPNLPVQAICADFTRPLPEVLQVRGTARLLMFLGSSIGNFTPEEAADLLRTWRSQWRDSALLIGVDLDKDPERLIAAYDDKAGVTAAFNRNVLQRLNEELRADFDVGAFRHRAVYCTDPPRVEMHLESVRDQQVRVAGTTVHFDEGERIHTESSYKYSLDSFRAVARTAGWLPQQCWTDPDGLFSLHRLVCRADRV